MHLPGVPYHLATNGAATPIKVSLQRFLMQYRRTPLLCGYSPSELLNGRQMRTAIDVLIPSPAHQAQERQSKQAAKAVQRLAGRSGPQYRVGTPCYALYCGPRQVTMGTCCGHQSTWSSLCLCQSLPKATNMAEAC